MKIRAFMAALAVMATAVVANAKTKEITLKWIHTSDVHSALFGYDYLAGKQRSGGLSAVYSYAQKVREQWGDRLIMTDGGDCLQGQPLTYYYNFVDTQSPHLVAQCMNEMGYVAGAVGNHDIETGHAVYDRWIEQCDFPILGANIIDVKTGEPYVKPYIIVEREGVRIAILGLITPAIPNWLPEKLWEGLRFEEMVEAAQKWRDIIMEKEHPHLLVGLFHSGYDGGIETEEYSENASRKVAEKVPGFDLICYGHDHRPRVETVEYPDGGKCVLMGPNSSGRSVCEAEIKLTIKNGNVVKKKVAATAPSITCSESPAAKEFEERFAEQRRIVSEWVNEPIGTLTRTIRERDAFFGSSEFIDLIHQMQLDLTDADISFAAPVSFDSSLSEGTIRVRDMFRLYKYENMLYTMRLTGREVKDFLEMSYGLWTNQMTSPDDHIMLLDLSEKEGRRQGFKNISYNMDSAAGILYTVDVTKPVGEKVMISSMADGTPFSLDKEYKVAINSYRGNGGGELLTKGAGIPQEKLAERILNSTQKDLRYYLMQRIKSLGTVTPQRLDHWHFIPEEWVVPACKRDRLLLFPDGN